MAKFIIMFAAASLLAPSALRAPQDDKQDGKKVAAPTLSVKLLDEEAKKKQQAATVEATVGGLDIVDPATAHEIAKAGQGHIHYQFDDGPVIATTVTKLSFHMIKAGKHTIKVTLAGNDHKSLGVEQSVSVDIPGM